MPARRRAALAATLALAALAVGRWATARPEVPRGQRSVSIAAGARPALADPALPALAEDAPAAPIPARDDLDDDDRPRAPSHVHGDVGRASAIPGPNAALARRTDPAGPSRSFLSLRRIRC